MTRKAAVFNVGRKGYVISLEGAAAAILKIEECVSRKGVLPTARATPAAQPR